MVSISWRDSACAVEVKRDEQQPQHLPMATNQEWTDEEASAMAIGWRRKALECGNASLGRSTRRRPSGSVRPSIRPRCGLFQFGGQLQDMVFTAEFGDQLDSHRKALLGN